MTELVLLQKIYGPRRNRCLEILQRSLESLAEGLEAKIAFTGQTERGWAKVHVEGPDRLVAINYLRRRFGLTSGSYEALRLPSNVSGHIVDAGEVGYGLYVDIGIEHPENIDVLIPLRVLRSQLADGARTSTRKIMETYGILDNFPISMRLTKIDKNEKKLDAELSDAQISLFQDWIHDGLDRVLAFGIPTEDLEEAIRRSALRRDIIKVESLSLYEHSLLCKIGTNAPGVIKSLGSYLPNIPLSAFSPTTAMTLLGSPIKLGVRFSLKVLG